MIRAVLDCNVVITAALSGGKCAELLSRARRRDGFELVWTPVLATSRIHDVLPGESGLSGTSACPIPLAGSSLFRGA